MTAVDWFAPYFQKMVSNALPHGNFSASHRFVAAKSHRLAVGLLHRCGHACENRRIDFIAPESIDGTQKILAGVARLETKQDVAENTNLGLLAVLYRSWNNSAAKGQLEVLYSFNANPMGCITAAVSTQSLSFILTCLLPINKNPMALNQ